MNKWIHNVIVFLCMTVFFTLYGQQDKYIQNLPNDWHPDSPYLYNPHKQSTYSLIMPYDSIGYKSRNLIRLPFAVIPKVVVAKLIP